VFDEFDSIAPARALADAQHQQALVAQLLTLLDGIEARRGVYLVATTNRPEALDPAVRRPGRFDRIVWMQKPNLAGRMAILQHHLRPLRLDPAICDRDTLVHDLASRTRGASGADLAFLCQQAVRCCIREAVGAGPRVLADGHPVFDPGSENFSDPKILSLSGARSAAGFTGNGILYLITVRGARVADMGHILRRARPARNAAPRPDSVNKPAEPAALGQQRPQRPGRASAAVGAPFWKTPRKPDPQTN
jgi:SpoVK/Ycf46/Vps4 family AAA+-type ATPase